jgi:hypothetical protein
MEVELFVRKTAKVGVGFTVAGVGVAVGVHPTTDVQVRKSAMPPISVQAWQLMVQY